MQLLTASSISKRFGGIVAVEDVSISISPLETKCIIGANGAGKSTLFNVLCGSLIADSGTLSFEGRDISRLALHSFSRIGIARKFQIPSVFESLTVEQNFAVAVLGRKTNVEIDESVNEIIAIVALDEQRNQLAGYLAHGQKQWLEIGMALMSRPKLLLLDEPTAGMTPAETQRTADLINRISGRTAVIVIEHDMSFVRALNCHTYVMHQGRLIVEGSFGDIEKNGLVRDVYLGRG
jgi:branched-chain amino acid transport system ATP-binding protein